MTRLSTLTNSTDNIYGNRIVSSPKQAAHQKVQDYFDRYYCKHCFIFLHPSMGNRSSDTELLIRFSLYCRDHNMDFILSDQDGNISHGHLLQGINLQYFPYDDHITVISFHPKCMKLTPHRTLFVGWLPVIQLLPYIQNITTFDGYLSSYSLVVDKFVQSITLKELPFYGFLNPSVPRSSFEPIRKNWKDIRLCYIGTHWSHHNSNQIQLVKNERLELLKELDHRGMTKLYGPRRLYENQDVLTWGGFRTYFGEIAFDGVSVIRTIRECGICLILTSVVQNRSEVCSMRIFEAIAAGVPIICNKNEFIQWWFRNNVFYIEGNTVEEKITDIERHLEWIVANPMVVHEKIKTCRSIVEKNLSMDVQMEDLLTNIEGVENK